MALSMCFVAQEAPHLLRNLTDQVVNTSHSVTLECFAHGVPEPQLSWFKNSEEIQDGPGECHTHHNLFLDSW